MLTVFAENSSILHFKPKSYGNLFKKIRFFMPIYQIKKNCFEKNTAICIFLIKFISFIILT